MTAEWAAQGRSVGLCMSTAWGCSVAQHGAGHGRRVGLGMGTAWGCAGALHGAAWGCT